MHSSNSPLAATEYWCRPHVTCVADRWISQTRRLKPGRPPALRSSESQVAAIRLALMSKALLMTGGPGVGKTTIVKAILRILAAKGINILLCAPSGRAAKRMTEATGFEAKTIHRLLEVDP
jgi:ATP-dependent exoDNAse (exonuclease V) alpha subunit